MPNPYWATGSSDPDRFWSAYREYGSDGFDRIHDMYGDRDTYEADRPD